MQKVTRRPEIVKEFALFLKGNAIRRQVTKFKILRRADMLSETSVKVSRRATDERYTKPAKVIDVPKSVRS